MKNNPIKANKIEQLKIRIKCLSKKVLGSLISSWLTHFKRESKGGESFSGWGVELVASNIKLDKSNPLCWIFWWWSKKGNSDFSKTVPLISFKFKKQIKENSGLGLFRIRSSSFSIHFPLVFS